MRRLALATTVLALALGLAAACSDDGSADVTGTTASSVSTSSVSTSSVASTSSRPQGVTTTAATATTRPSDPCADPAGPIADSELTTPADANRECDAAAGWRIFFWIGESSDPIYRVQWLDDRRWVDGGYDVACGLDAATLRELGVPSQLATAWGEKYDEQC